MASRLSSIFLGVLAASYGATVFSASSKVVSSNSVSSSKKEGVKHPSNGMTKESKLAIPSTIHSTTQSVAQMAGMTEYRLPNGLRVVLVPDASKPVTTVNVTYQVGSRHEQYGETGMAHLLEHMLFKGTPTIPHLTQELSSRGMRPNGTTWYDRTNYFETFAASDDKLEWALKMEADRMVNAFIARKDLDSEMTVVRNEMESGENDPGKMLLQRVSSAAYQWHNYGKETIGARSDVEGVGIDRLKAFYTRYYQPDNAVLVVAGAFDTAKALSWIQHYFGAIPRPERTLAHTYTEEPAQDGERTVHLQRVGSDQGLALLYHIPAATHPDFPAVEVLAEMLSNSPSGRLYQTLVDTNKATSVSAYAYPLKEPGHLIFNVELREESSIAEAQRLLLQGVESFAMNPVKSEELEWAKRSLTNSWNQTIRDPQKLGVALSQAIAVGDWRFFLMNQDRLNQVTVQDVERVARAYLQPVNRTLGFFTPTKTSMRVAIPKAEPVEAQLKGYQPQTKIAQGEAFDPSFENIEQRVKRFQLANGAKLAVLPKKNRGETVNVYAQLHWGDEITLKGAQWKGELLAPLLMRGTEQLSHRALTEELEKLDAQLSLDSSVDGLTLHLETTRPNLEAALRLVSTIFKTPRFDVKEWDVLKQQTIAGLESSQTEPSTWASRQLERHQQPYSVDDPRYSSSLEEDLVSVKKLSLDEVKVFYREMFSTQYSEWAVVGEAEPEGMKKVLDGLVGDMKAHVPYQRIDFKVFKPAEEVLVKQIPDKANALLNARFLMALEDTHPDYPALVAANTLLGGGFLNSRLAMRIRQKEGISYGVGSYLKTSSDEPFTEWRLYALFAPQNRDRLLKVFHDELALMQKEPVEPVLLKEAIQGWLESRRLGRSQDGRLAVSLAEWMRLGRTAHDSEMLENNVKNLQPKAVEAAIKKYLQPAQWVYSVAGTFSESVVKDTTVGHTPSLTAPQK